MYAKYAIATVVLALAVSARSENYKIKASDNDYTIARQFGISVAALHRDNPHVDWRRLTPGHIIDIPVSGSQADQAADKQNSARQVSNRKESDTSTSDADYYVVRGNDNDYTIARKIGISLKELHDLNPDVDWNRLGPGKRVRVSSGSSASYESSEHSNSSSSSHFHSHVIHTLHAVIDGNNVRLHDAPGLKSETVTTVDAGTVAKVVRRDGAWYELKFPKGTVAWVRSDFLAPAKHIYSGDYAEEFHHRSRSHHETEVADETTRHDYYPGDYVYAPSEDDSKLIQTAFRYRGTPYVWGGTSRSGGFDCSGFTKKVYSVNGVDLPRTSREQSEVGMRVSENHLKQGDLVFFHTDGTGEVSHVGIYIGHNKFIHASSGGGRVMVSSLDQSYYANRFAGGRRIIRAESPQKSKKHSTVISKKSSERAHAKKAKAEVKSKPKSQSKSNSK